MRYLCESCRIPTRMYELHLYRVNEAQHFICLPCQKEIVQLWFDLMLEEPILTSPTLQDRLHWAQLRRIH